VQIKKTDLSAPSQLAVLSDTQHAILSLLIDVPYYEGQANQNFDDAAQAAEHYVRIGWRNGFDPTRTFCSVRFVAVVCGIFDADKCPFVSYLFDGVGEDVIAAAINGLNAIDIASIRVQFDADWYLRSYPDVEQAAVDPFIHYMTIGWQELRDPTPSFSTSAYLERYADIRAAALNPYRHWVLHGLNEGRSGGRTVSSALDGWENLTDIQQQILSEMFRLPYFRPRTANTLDDNGETFARRAASGAPDLQNSGGSFQAAKYIASRSDVHDAGDIPFLHYLFKDIGTDILLDLFVARSRQILQAICEHFDGAWYLYSYPDVEARGQDALIHFMTTGWREGRNPSQEFSTRIYQIRYPDIVEANINPFLHWIEFGKAEGRSGASSASNFRSRRYAPHITAVLINRDANPLTPNCVAAVTGQSYRNLDFLVVGAPLSEECSAALNKATRRQVEGLISYLAYDGNAAMPRLVELAAEQSSASLLWFVQGRAIHNAEFLARLTSSFADGSVQLGFGRPLTPDDLDYSVSDSELARRMEGWAQHPTTPAATWFPERLQLDLSEGDQHSFLWRRRHIGAEVWRQASAYHELGLWHLYLHMASGGQIATVRDALLRVPSVEASAATLLVKSDRLCADMDALVAETQSFWAVPDDVRGVRLKIDRNKRHVLIVTHGIFAGGAENLPIQMANELTTRGLIVSLLIFKTELNPQMHATLNPGVSIYESDWVMEYGCEQFLHDTGCSLIHSHGVIGEMFFFRLCKGPLPVPYVATLHGSYEASTSTELPERFIAKIVRNVDLFVYTADKNLGPLSRHDVRPGQVIKMINAMPVDKTPFPKTRAELGIAEDAIVFTLVARGIPEKGWSTAINAFKAIQKRLPHRLTHLCLIGEGEEQERLKAVHGGNASISFLGFQLRIHGMYRLTDVAIVPTRFAGESFPLCIIQALQVGVPVIATDIGEIASMLRVEDVAGGIVVQGSDDDKTFDKRFAVAMLSLIDNNKRTKLAAGATTLGKQYDMAVFTDQYINLYEEVISSFATTAGARIDEIDLLNA
jgi:glycosyltransferase involved in cell wall biosynthesis